MKTITLSDLNILDIGHSIQLYGAIYSGNGKVYLIPLPDEDPSDLETLEVSVLRMDADDMERFLNQTDVLDVQGLKAILRKSQRQIDQAISWKVFASDHYTCRYCGKTGLPLTVDHIDLWENGGATIVDNLLTACRRCNKLRSNTPYAEWIVSKEYQRVSSDLMIHIKRWNLELIEKLPGLELKRIKARSR